MLGQVQWRDIRRVIGFNERTRLPFFRRKELDVGGPHNARLPELRPQVFLAHSVPQAPDLGTVILNVVRENEFDQRLVGGQIKLVMNLVHDRADQLQHADADVFDFAWFLVSFLARTTKGVCSDRRQLGVEAGRLAGSGSGPVHGAQKHADSAGTDGQHGRAIRADFAAAAGSGHDNRIVSDTEDDMPGSQIGDDFAASTFRRRRPLPKCNSGNERKSQQTRRPLSLGDCFLERKNLHTSRRLDALSRHQVRLYVTIALKALNWLRYSLE